MAFGFIAVMIRELIVHRTGFVRFFPHGWINVGHCNESSFLNTLNLETVDLVCGNVCDGLQRANLWKLVSTTGYKIIIKVIGSFQNSDFLFFC